MKPFLFCSRALSGNLRVRGHERLLPRLEGAEHARRHLRHRRLLPDDQGRRRPARLRQHQEHARRFAP